MAELLGLRIRKFNMFQTGKIYDFPDEGEKLLLRDKIDYTPSIFDASYSVKTNDTIWGIAYYHYRDKVQYPSRYWWVIADANDIYNPYNISDLIGSKIIIPDIASILLTT